MSDFYLSSYNRRFSKEYSRDGEDVIAFLERILEEYKQKAKENIGKVKPDIEKILLEVLGVDFENLEMEPDIIRYYPQYDLYLGFEIFNGNDGVNHSYRLIKKPKKFEYHYWKQTQALMVVDRGHGEFGFKDTYHMAHGEEINYSVSEIEEMFKNRLKQIFKSHNEFYKITTLTTNQ